jgi:DNA-binding CsgD family transcriptional regulator
MSQNFPSDNGTGRSNGNGERMLPESLVVRFLNQLPVTGNLQTWVTGFRESLIILFPDIGHITLNVNFLCDLVNPSQYIADHAVTEHFPGEHDANPGITVQFRDESEIPHQRLLADFRAKGFPFGKYHDPIAHDYYLEGTAYVGTLFLWAYRGKESISTETLATFAALEPFITFAFTDLIARRQNAHPFDRAFSLALQAMAADAQLSEQERRVAALLLYGNSYEAIAELMNLSVHTIRKHTQSIYRKTGTSGSNEMFAKYFTPRSGL